MSAQPIEHSDPQRIDPQRILRVLPDAYREVFLAEYRDAARAAIDPAGWSDLNRMLGHWSLRAIAYSRPGFEQARADAAARRGEYVSLEEVMRLREQAHG
jgi:uncharacterized protein DUF6247